MAPYWIYLCHHISIPFLSFSSGLPPPREESEHAPVLLLVELEQSLSSLLSSSRPTLTLVLVLTHPLQVLPSDDPFDEQNFDAAKIINGYFPSEQSLNTAESVAERLAGQMGKVDNLILQAVEHQSSAGEQAKLDLEQANTSVSKLTEGLTRISVRSRRTEETVRHICSDIQTLDWAKQNLTLTITVLRRLNMLETALEQLEDMTKVWLPRPQIVHHHGHNTFPCTDCTKPRRVWFGIAHDLTINGVQYLFACRRSHPHPHPRPRPCPCPSVSKDAWGSGRVCCHMVCCLEGGRMCTCR